MRHAAIRLRTIAKAYQLRLVWCGNDDSAFASGVAVRAQGEPEKVNAQEYLQAIYRDPTKPIAVRMRAAIESLYENPRLSAVAVGRLTGEDFASRLDRAVDASNRAKLIEGQVIDRVD